MHETDKTYVTGKLLELLYSIYKINNNVQMITRIRGNKIPCQVTLSRYLCVHEAVPKIKVSVFKYLRPHVY